MRMLQPCSQEGLWWWGYLSVWTLASTVKTLSWTIWKIELEGLLIDWEKQEILQAFGLSNCGYDGRFYGGEETWERIEFGGKNQEFSFVHIALEMPLHVGVVGVGHGNMELRGETGVGVIMAVLVIQMVFMSHAGTY